MTKAYVRFRESDGTHIALILRENHYPAPEPRNETEAIYTLTDEEYLRVQVAPDRWNYSYGMIMPLYEGRLSVSALTFYPSGDINAEQNPDLDFDVEFQPQFPELPMGEPIKIRINNTIHEIPNYCDPHMRLTSDQTGLFVLAVEDPRVWVEQRSFLINCLPIPDTEEV